MTASQNAQLRAILLDGKWHSSAELHSRVYCLVHVRIAEMRRQGYRIEHKGGGAGAANHYYRLVKPAAPPENPSNVTRWGAAA